MMRLFLLCSILCPLTVFAHPSDYPNGIDPKEASAKVAPSNSQAFEAKQKEENSFSLNKFFKLVKDKLDTLDKTVAENKKEEVKKENKPKMKVANQKTFNSKNPELNKLLKNPLFKNAIDLALLGMAFLSWVGYISSFDPAQAFAKVIHPAILTFLSFQWTQVFAWLGL